MSFEDGINNIYMTVLYYILDKYVTSYVMP